MCGTVCVWDGGWVCVCVVIFLVMPQLRGRRDRGGGLQSVAAFVGAAEPEHGGSCHLAHAAVSVFCGSGRNNQRHTDAGQQNLP